MGITKLLWVLTAVAVLCAVLVSYFPQVFLPTSVDMSAEPVFDKPETELIGKNKLKSATTDEEITIESLWEKQPVVIVFFRRWGCMFCRVAAHQISAIKEELDAHNVRLVGVGVEHVGKEEFIKGQFFKGDLFVDEEKKCYKDLKYKRFGWLSLIPQLVSKSSREVFYNKGYKLGSDMTGDYYQVGGVLVVAEGGSKVLLSHRHQSLSDFVDPNEVLKSLGIPPKDLKFEYDKVQCSTEDKSACQ